LPDGIVIDSDAVVRSTEPGVAAVEFTHMHATDRETIGRWTVAVMRAALNGQG
jgi:predicted MarR family transcription regulator